MKYSLEGIKGLPIFQKDGKKEKKMKWGDMKINKKESLQLTKIEKKLWNGQRKFTQTEKCDFSKVQLKYPLSPQQCN